MINLLLCIVIVISFIILLLILTSKDIGYYKVVRVSYLGKKEDTYYLSYNGERYSISPNKNRELHFLLSIRDLREGDTVEGVAFHQERLFSSTPLDRLISINKLKIREEK